MSQIKPCEMMVLSLDNEIVRVMASHVADVFGLVELQVLDAEGIEFITLTTDEIERARIL